MNTDVASALHSAGAYVLQASNKCYRCGHTGPIFGVLPVGPFEVVGDVGCEPESDDALTMSTPETLPDVIAAQLTKVSNGMFRPDYSASSGFRYWMNHCTSCGAKVGAFYIYSEPGEGFFPTADEDFQRISGTLIDGPFSFPEPDLGHSGALEVWLYSARHGVSISEAHRCTSGIKEIKWFEIRLDGEGILRPSTSAAAKNFVSSSGRMCAAATAAHFESRELADEFAAWIKPKLEKRHGIALTPVIVEMSKSAWAGVGLQGRQTKITAHSKSARRLLDGC